MVVAPHGELLAERGVASEAPALPSCGETGEPTSAEGPGLAEDVAAVRQVLTASDEPAVVVAHSYGGIVTAEAAAGLDTVHHLLLVSSYLPEVGQSLSSFGGEEPAPFLDIDPEGGTFTVRPDALAETFLQDCDPEIQQQSTAGRPGRAWRSSDSRCSQRPGSTCPPRTSSAPRTEAPPQICNGSSPSGQGASPSSMPVTTRSSPSRPPSATWSSGCDGARRSRLGQREADTRAGGRALEPDVPAVRFDDRARDREAEAGALAGSRGVVAAPIEGLEQARAIGGVDAVAGVGDLDLTSSPLRSARTVTDPSAGVWRIAFWIRLNSTRWSFSGLACVGLRPVRNGGAHDHVLGVRLRAHRVDGLLDQRVQAHALDDPADVARLEPRELEEVVDQARQRRRCACPSA